VRRAKLTRADLSFIAKQADKNFVYWLERRGRGIYIQASPVDVSDLLRKKLFENVDTCILTSATLSANGSFNFIRDRLGLNMAGTNTLVAPSSFDHEKQAILYLPMGMPDPRSPDFTRAAAPEIIKILHASQGHAFVLCTSNSSMAALYEIVSSRIDYPCFLQGTMSKAGLLEKFRETPNAVLFATSSFWQGVDVRGEQLSCVIIDKLPFAVPSDPLVAARTKFIDENGGRSFFDYSVPQAIISLKQGIGRLIRSSTDRGVIAILDPRLRTKGYGRDFLNSLPRMRITADLVDVASVIRTADDDAI
jgi:ATP-dependent DNA helicase DinG